MGFAKATDSSSLDPEYVKLQRKEVIEEYSKKVSGLKEEISVLESKKASLEADLALAFNSRQALIESNEKVLKVKEGELSSMSINLRHKAVALDERQEADLKAHQIRLSELQAETAKSESILTSVRAESEKLENSKNKLTKQLLDVSSQEANINTKESRLQEEKDKISEERGKLEALKSSLEAIQKDIDSQKQVLALRQTSANQEISQLSELRESLEKDRLLNETSLKELEIQNDKNSVDLALNKEILADIKRREQALKENENKFRVWEQSSKNDLSARTRELDERESRIKKLESSIGGK